MSSTAFSSDGQEALFHQIESTFLLEPSTSTGRKDLREYFEIERCVEFIQSDQSFQRVKFIASFCCYVSVTVLDALTHFL